MWCQSKYTVQRVLGSGSFGRVYLHLLNDGFTPTAAMPLVIAVKRVVSSGGMMRDIGVLAVYH